MRCIRTLVVAVLLSGCYAYQPMTAGAPSTGKYVRAELTDAGAAAVAPAIGSNVLWVEGEIQSTDDGRITVALRTVNRRTFGESTWNGETVSLAAGDVRTLQERVLSRGRTTAFVSVVSAGAIGVIYAIATASGLVSGSSGRTTPPPP